MPIRKKEAPTKGQEKKEAPTKGVFIGRTPLQWAQLFIFILLTWGFLAAFSLSCWACFTAITRGDPDVPYWRRHTSIVSPAVFTQPGLHYENASDECQYCLGISVNCVIDWTPDYMKLSESDLKDALKDAYPEAAYSSEATLMYVTCKGKTKSDQEKIGGVKVYNGKPGFGSDAFPCRGNQENNDDDKETKKKRKKARMMVLDFTDTKAVKNADPETVITIDCRSWAKNVIDDSTVAYKGLPGAGARILFKVDKKADQKISEATYST